MSYTICYGRQFIKTSRGIIPLFLAGSNNCWMLYKNHQIRERDWNIMCRSEMIELPADELLASMKEMYSDDNSEYFRANGKFVYRAGAIKFVENGIKNAKTVEEILTARPGQSIRCYVTEGMDYYLQGQATVQHVYVKTTAELEAWLDEAKAYVAASTDNAHMYIHFAGAEPLRIEKTRKEPTGSVLATTKAGQYVTEFTETSLTTSKDIAKAMVFASIEEAKQQLPERLEPFRYIRATAKEKAKENVFVLKVTNGNRCGLFVDKLGGRRISFSQKATTVRKRFATEKAAKAWYDKMVAGRFDGIKEIMVCDSREAIPESAWW